MILLASCQPGLEAILGAEIGARGLGSGDRVQPGLWRARRRLDAGDLGDALRLRTADDLYVELLAGAAPALADRLRAAPFPLPAEALALQGEILRRAGRRPAGRVKATCFADGRSGLDRRDLQRCMEASLLAARPGWRLEETRPDAEFVAFVSAGQARLALRLTDPSFRHRGYGRAPAALSPTVAAALVALAEPAADDRFLDPCCGGGTILLERAQAGVPYLALIGGDASEQALEVAQENFGARHRPWSLQRWDARRLPLPAGSVSRVVTNLPFGVQSPAAGGVSAFATACLAEVGRVLAPAGRAVLLWPATEPAIVPGSLCPERATTFSLVGQRVSARFYRRAPG